MKKLVFVSIAALVMVSVNSVFGTTSAPSIQTSAPEDSTAKDSLPNIEQADTVKNSEKSVDTTQIKETAMLFFSDSTSTDSVIKPKTDSTAVAML